MKPSSTSSTPVAGRIRVNQPSVSLSEGRVISPVRSMLQAARSSTLLRRMVRVKRSHGTTSNSLHSLCGRADPLSLSWSSRSSTVLASMSLAWTDRTASRVSNGTEA